MKPKKPRKPRGIKKSGYKSYDLCLGCYHRRCDPAEPRPPKVDERLREGLCPGCGHDPCTCKSTSDLPKIKMIPKTIRDLFTDNVRKLRELHGG